MRILVVGNGAREDALSWRLAQSPSCSAIFAAPGNAGTATRGENWDCPATNGKKLAHLCVDNKIDLVVLGPETAIAAGVADQLRERGIPTFGPSRSSGRLESSKIFSKKFMERHGVPTANAVVVHALDTAIKALEAWPGGCVVKADGLAGGKGVVVTDDALTARAVVTDWYGNNRVPGGGTGVLLEEKLQGREVSVFAICDGRAMLPFAAACDYKRAGDGDTGPNTGGMGAYSPPSDFPEDLFDQVRVKILAPVLRGLLAEGETFLGVLYCGLMWTEGGPKVIEFNVRFGDPETQVLMPLVSGDFAQLLKSCADGVMDTSVARISEQTCVGVVLATEDYPKTSTPLKGVPAELHLGEQAQAFWGGSVLRDGKADVNGGRVLTVTATGDSITTARASAYDTVDKVAEQFDTSGAKLTYRSDIASALD